MDIVKIDNPGMAYMLHPWFLTLWEPIGTICRRLYKMMAEKPDDTLLCASVESDRVHGIAMAYIDGEDCILWQMNGMNAKQADPPITSWARAKGCKRLVLHTDRNPKVWERKYGFKLDSTEQVDNMTKYTMSRTI